GIGVKENKFISNLNAI
ncbi:hypothetical protein CISIN_1g0244892mg, partial [Citrus sinensis]